MRYFAFIFLMVPCFALAQPTDQVQSAVAQEVAECGIGRIQLRVRIAQLEAEIAKLKTSPQEEKKP